MYWTNKHCRIIIFCIFFEGINSDVWFFAGIWFLLSMASWVELIPLFILTFGHFLVKPRVKPRVAAPVLFRRYEALDENNFSGLPWSSGRNALQCRMQWISSMKTFVGFGWFQCVFLWVKHGQTHHINGPFWFGSNFLYAVIGCHAIYLFGACDTAQVYGQSQHSRCAEGPVLNQDQDALWPHQTPVKFITFW